MFERGSDMRPGAIRTSDKRSRLWSGFISVHKGHVCPEETNTTHPNKVIRMSESEQCTYYNIFTS